MNGLVYGMSDTEYHSRPELSSTGARALLPEYEGSPKKFQHALTNRRESRAFDVGHAAHAKVLGVGAGIVTYPAEHLTPSGNVSTKAATVEWEREQRAAGLTPVSPDEITRVNGMAEAILADDRARLHLEVAVHREVSVFATVDGVECRARFDALSDTTRSGVFGVDLKTTEDATKAGFERSVARYGYDVQLAHYRDVYQAATGHPVEEFVLIVVEKNAPYEVGVFKLPDLWLEIGHTKAAEARRLYRECMDTGQWPGYSSEIQYLDPPTWLVFDHETKYEEINI